MMCDDPKLSEELRKTRNNYINIRWEQLYSLSKEAGDSAFKYLFATNFGGTIAVLAYLGSIAESGATPTSAKIALLSFFIGLIVVGVYRACDVHYCDDVFEHYQKLVKKYYKGEIDWEYLTKKDEAKEGNPLTPYILGYISCIFFIGGCIAIACTLKNY